MPGTASPKEDRQAPDNPLSFHSIACSERLREQLDHAVRGSRVPVLLVGEEGAGKHYMAYRLAAALLCDRPVPGSGACGHCPSCRILRSGSHLDLVMIAPEDNKTSIPVASIRSQVAANLQIYPQVSRQRVYLIEALKADTLNEQGQNALLKPLEEHPDFARFLTLAEEAARPLPTIRSRPQVIRIGRRSREEVGRVLDEAGCGGPSSQVALNYADGLPGQALALVRDESFRELRDRVFELVTALPQANRTYCLTEALTFLKDERKQIKLILRIIDSFLRDLLLLQEGMGPETLVNADLAGALESWQATNPAADPARAADLVGQTGRALGANANFDHTTARMLLGLRAFLGGHRITDGVFRDGEGLL